MKYVYFAQAYGSGSYGSCDYSEGSTAAGVCAASTGTGSPPPPSSGSGGLVDTGFAVIGIVTLASLTIFVALLVRMWRRRPAANKNS